MNPTFSGLILKASNNSTLNLLPNASTMTSSCLGIQHDVPIPSATPNALAYWNI